MRGGISPTLSLESRKFHPPCRRDSYKATRMASGTADTLRTKRHGLRLLHGISSDGRS